MPRVKEEKRDNFIEHGSDEHAALLGLVKDKETGAWALEDVTMYGPNARPEFLAQVLRQKVSELETAPVVSKHAPALWVPTD